MKDKEITIKMDNGEDLNQLDAFVLLEADCAFCGINIICVQESLSKLFSISSKELNPFAITLLTKAIEILGIEVQRSRKSYKLAHAMSNELNSHGLNVGKMAFDHHTAVADAMKERMDLFNELFAKEQAHAEKSMN